MLKYVQYGCGLSAPEQWINYDVSPTLRLQKIPILGKVIQKNQKTVFPDNVKYGDILKGLPEANSTVKGVYCSHTLEHLSLEDFGLALRNTYQLLEDGGIFRCVVPDLEAYILEYVKEINGENKGKASFNFLEKSYLGKQIRLKGIKGVLHFLFSNNSHLWMWDKYSLNSELIKIGFKNVRLANFNDSSDTLFKLVENKDRFYEAVAFECIK